VILASIESPADLQGLSYDELNQLSAEIREFIISTVTTTGGHLGSNLGVVELTVACTASLIRRRTSCCGIRATRPTSTNCSPGDAKVSAACDSAAVCRAIPTAPRASTTGSSRQHASTALSYAHGLSVALEQRKELIGRGGKRHVVAVVGDGSLTGGMAFEALNNLGHSNQRVVVILNDNGRSYAPTISKLSESLTSLRLNRTYVQLRERIRGTVPKIPAVGQAAYLGMHGVTSVMREMVTPHTFFETLGVRYVGPIDGHNIESLETALRSAALWDGPIVIHVLTEKGRGYAPAISDDLKLHDYKLPPRVNDEVIAPQSFIDTFANSLLTMAAPTSVSLPSPPRWPVRWDYLTSRNVSRSASLTSASPSSTP
jgi:1-deoxy-D-xylulose-5-phosphate synthase